MKSGASFEAKDKIAFRSNHVMSATPRLFGTFGHKSTENIKRNNYNARLTLKYYGIYLLVNKDV